MGGGSGEDVCEGLASLSRDFGSGFARGGREEGGRFACLLSVDVLTWYSIELADVSIVGTTRFGEGGSLEWSRVHRQGVMGIRSCGPALTVVFGWLVKRLHFCEKVFARWGDKLCLRELESLFRSDIVSRVYQGRSPTAIPVAVSAIGMSSRLWHITSERWVLPSPPAILPEAPHPKRYILQLPYAAHSITTPSSSPDPSDSPAPTRSSP